MILVAGLGLFIMGAVVGGALVASSRWFTQPTRDLKSLKKQYNVARQTLMKIGSGDAGLPELEARLALDDINND